MNEDYQNLISSLDQGPDRWNRSSVERISRAILGPTARTWKVPGYVVLGHDRNGVKMELGRGKDYETAFKAVFVDTVRMREDYKKFERGEDVDTNR